MKTDKILSHKKIFTVQYSRTTKTRSVEAFTAWSTVVLYWTVLATWKLCCAAENFLSTEPLST